MPAEIGLPSSATADDAPLVLRAADNASPWTLGLRRIEWSGRQRSTIWPTRNELLRTNTILLVRSRVMTSARGGTGRADPIAPSTNITLRAA